MTKIKIALILLSCILRVLTENRSSEAQAKIDNFVGVSTHSAVSHKQLSNVYIPPKEEPSFMSKVASWIFPFGGTSDTSSDSTPSETQQRYAPQYLPPLQHGHPKQPCNPCNSEPWIPVAGNHGRDTVIGFVQQSHLKNPGYQPSSDAYGVPSSNLQDFHPPPLIPQISQQYGSPPAQQQHISSPILSQYGTPSDHYGVPTNSKPVFDQPPANFRIPAQHFIPPPLPKHAIPLFKSVGLPTQKGNHPKLSFPPSKRGVLKSAPFKFKPNSPPQHGPPIPLNFEKSQFDKYKFSHPPAATKLPFLNTNFNTPSATSHSVKAYTPTYPNQGILLQPPPFNVDYFARLPTYQTSGGSEISGNQQLPSIFLPNYDIPQLPISSGHVEQNILSGSRYNYPIFNYGQSSNGVNKPSTGQTYHPTGSLHSSQSFQTGTSLSTFDNLQHDSQPKIKANNEQSVHDVQVIPSIRIADYLASIEHPINVIQSPLVEVIATENNQSNDGESPINDDVSNKVQLNENPIIVDTHDDDTHAAATAQNLTYYNPTQNEKRNNDKYVATSFSLNNQNSDKSSPFETLNTSFSDVQIATTLERQRPADLSDVTVNATKYFSNSEFPHSLVGDIQNINDPQIYKEIENQPLFTQPPMDYSNWTPSFGTLSTSIVPPPLGEPVWDKVISSRPATTTTKKPKQVQIIIPYISNNPSSVIHSNLDFYKKDIVNIRNSKEHETNSADITAVPSRPSLPLYTQPPTVEESVWSHYVTNYNQGSSSKVVTSTEKYVSASNIRDLLLKEETITNNLNKLPFDVIRLQKNIDDWTEQEFSNGIINTQKASTNGKLVPSKKIPTEYLSTQPYNKGLNEITTLSSIQEILFDHEPAGSQTKLSKIESHEDIDTNLISIATTPASTLASEAITTSSPPVSITIGSSKPSTSITAEITTTEVSLNGTLLATPGPEVTLPVVTPNPMWEKLQVSISPSTKEKVYVVTPQPWKILPKEINEKLLSITESSSAALTPAKFSVVIQPEGNKRPKALTKDSNGGLQIVYSEWPHIINNLQTTTTTTENPKNTNHPLFGLMDLFSYMPPPNSTVETYGGHSKVVTVVTPASVTKKNSKANEKTTTRTTPLSLG